MLFAGGIFLLFIFFSKTRLNLVKGDISILMAGSLLALHWALFYGSIKYANVSVGVVCFCLSGFFTAILSPLMNKRRISVVELLLSLLTLVGISLIFHFDVSFRLGIILGVMSSFLFALFAIINERINQRNNVLKTTTLEMIGGALGISILLPLYLYFFPEATILPSPEDTGYLFLLALGSTVFMCLMFNSAQKKINAFTVSLSFNLEPVYGILLAIILFQENKQLNFSFYLGLLFIVLSLALQMSRVLLKEKRK